jgi:hypothetical protein
VQMLLFSPPRMMGSVIVGQPSASSTLTSPV